MASSRIAGIVIEVAGNTTKLQDSLKDVNKSLKETYSQLRDVNKLLKLDPKNTELLRQKQELLSKAIADTKTKLDREKQALEQLKNADGSEKTRQQQEALTREIIATEQQLESLEKEYKEFGNVGTSATKEVAEKLQGIGANIKQVGEKVKDVGTTLSTKVTAPIVGVGTAAMVAFNKVDAALDTVTTKTGATGQALEDLHEITREIGRTSPFDFEQVGVAVGEVNTRFGLTGKNLENLSRQFLKFAKVNSVDVNSSIDSVQKMMAAFGVETEDAAAFLDLLNKVGQDSGIGFQQLGSALVSNATTLQSLGLNAADAAVLMGELEKSGMNVSDVMSGFQKVQKKAFTDGISTQEAFRRALSSSENAVDYFGKSAPKLYTAFQNGTLSVDMFTGGVHNLNESLGNLDDTYNNTFSIQDGLAESLNNLQDTGYELGKTIGEVLAPVLKELNELLKSFNEWFRSLDDDTKQMIVKCAAVVAAVGPVLVILGSVISAIGSIVSGIGGLIKLGGSAVGFFTNIGKAANIAPIVSAASSALSGLTGALAGIAAPVAAGVAAFASVTWAVNTVRNNWDALGDTITALGELQRARINEMVANANLLVTRGRVAFAQFAENMRSKISEGAEKARTAISTGLGAAQTYINTFGNSARNTMQMTWSNITSRISGAMTSIRTGISSGFSSAQSAATSAMNGLKSSVSGIWSSIQSNTSSVVGSIKNNTTELWNTLQSNISSAMSTAKNNVATAWTNIQNATSDARTAVKSALSEMTNKVQDFGGSVWTNLKNNVSSAWSGITSTINTALTNIKNAISNTTLKFGKVTIPTFSWSGTNNSEKGTTASIKVSSKEVSYASAMSSGAILDRPTIFGALDGNLLRAGEAGKEVVIGANSLSSMIRQSATNTALNADVANILGLLAQYLPETANQNVVLDSGKLVGALTPALNRQFGMMIRG